MPDRPSPTRDASTQLPLPRRELRSVVERITYQNPENGYTVARLAPERTDAPSGTSDERLITVVGTLPDLQPGEAIVASGFWINDPKHGWQFKALDARTTLPATLPGMKRYLGFGLVKGIGRFTRSWRRSIGCVLQATLQHFSLWRQTDADLLD